MEKQLIAGMFVMVFLIQPAAAQLSSSFPSLRVDEIRYEPFPAEAGKYFDLFIKVQNTGGVDAPNVACRLDPRYPFSLDPGADSEKDIGILPILESVLFQYKVRTASDAVEGDNEVLVTCGTNGLDNGAVTRTIIVNVDSKKPSFAVGKVTSLPKDITADMDDVKLTVEVQNIGEGDAKLTTVELILPDKFSPSTSFSTTDNLGLIEKDSVKEAVFDIDVENPPAGEYDAQLKIRFKDDNNNQNDYITQLINFNIQIQPSPQFTIKEVRAGHLTSSDSFTGYLVQDGKVVNPSTLAQNSVGELRIRVKNVGEEEAESVSVKVFEDSANVPIDFDEIFDFIGNLKPGEEGDAVFKFSIDGDAVLKEYLVETEVRFVENTEVDTERFTIPIEISQEAGQNPMIYAVIVIIIIAAAVVWKKKR